MVKLFPTFYGTRRFIPAFTSARHLSLSSARARREIPPQMLHNVLTGFFQELFYILNLLIKYFIRIGVHFRHLAHGVPHFLGFHPSDFG